MYNTEHKNELINFFKTNLDKAYSALEIIDLFSSTINKATIYRLLIKLELEKLIRRNYDEEKDCYVYQYACNCDSHLHLQCIKCGKIIHLQCDDANEFIKHISSNHNFFIDQYQTTIYGICGDCKKE